MTGFENGLCIIRQVMKKIGIILGLVLVLIILVLVLVYFSNESEISCKIIGGKFTRFEPGCMDCFFGCDSPLRQWFDYVRRGFRPSYLG